MDIAIEIISLLIRLALIVWVITMIFKTKRNTDEMYYTTTEMQSKLRELEKQNQELAKKLDDLKKE